MNTNTGPIGEGLSMTNTSTDTQNDNTPDNEIKSSFTSNILQTLIPTIGFYPFYRIYLEKKNIAFQKDFTKEKLSGIFKQVKERGGLFCGLNSYLFSKMSRFVIFNLAYSENLLISGSLFIGSTILSYPFLLNSNLKALNFPGYVSLKNYSDIYQLVSQKSSYRGLLYSILSEILFVLPFLNLLSHKYETMRLAYVFAPYYEHEFDNVKQAKEYLKVNKCFAPGRLTYNIVPHCINLFITSVFIYNLYPEAAKKGDANDRV